MEQRSTDGRLSIDLAAKKLLRVSIVYTSIVAEVIALKVSCAIILRERHTWCRALSSGSSPESWHA